MNFLLRFFHFDSEDALWRVFVLRTVEINLYHSSFPKPNLISSPRAVLNLRRRSPRVYSSPWLGDFGLYVLLFLTYSIMARVTFIFPVVFSLFWCLRRRRWPEFGLSPSIPINFTPSLHYGLVPGLVNILERSIVLLSLFFRWEVFRVSSLCVGLRPMVSVLCGVQGADSLLINLSIRLNCLTLVRLFFIFGHCIMLLVIFSSICCFIVLILILMRCVELYIISSLSSLVIFTFNFFVLILQLINIRLVIQNLNFHALQLLLYDVLLPA